MSDRQKTRASGATRIGIILTPDNAIDTELTLWCRPPSTVHVTRLSDWRPHFPDHSASSRFAAQPSLVAAATRTLGIIDVDVTVFACTSGSFVDGDEGERAIRETILEAGAKRAVTSSSAMIDAFMALDIRRVCIGTPYDDECTHRLVEFVEAHDVKVTKAACRPPAETNDVADYPAAMVAELADLAHDPSADAMFLSCAALPTYDVLPRLRDRLAMPVLSSVQVTMWSAARPVGDLGWPLVD